MEKNKINHIAFILDGNKRWSKINKLNSRDGYKRGFDKIIEIVKYSIKIDLPTITLFTLSSENYQRKSVSLIYEIIYENFTNLLEELVKKNNIKLRIFGNRNNLPEKIINIFKEFESINHQDVKLNLNLAFNYGFKDEILKVVKEINSNNINISNLKNDDLKKYFYLGEAKDPEILIRTGGYKRLSNFIMYNLTYTELFFTNTLWPEFTIDELNEIIASFNKIERKYGL